MLRGLIRHLRRQWAGFLALAIALGGTSYAAVTGSIDSREIKNNTVRSKDVRNRSLLMKDFKPGQLRAGPQGPQGQPGTQGPAGEPGTALAYAHVKADGTLDQARTKNVIDVRPMCGETPTPCSGPPPADEAPIQCFRLGFTPNNAVATHEATTGSSPAQNVVSVQIPGPEVGFLSAGCAPGYTDARSVTVSAADGTLQWGGFFIVFN